MKEGVVTVLGLEDSTLRGISRHFKPLKALKRLKRAFELLEPILVRLRSEHNDREAVTRSESATRPWPSLVALKAFVACGSSVLNLKKR